MLQIRPPAQVRIRPPIKGITLQHDPLRCDVILQPKWPESRPLRWRNRKTSKLRQLSLLIWLFQQMAGKNRQPVKQPITHAIRLRHPKHHVISIYLANLHRLSAHDQKVSLWRVERLIPIDSEPQTYII